jgi:SHS2 domain-containing protein
MTYQFRGDIAHADVAFDAQSETLEGLFKECADATMKVMVEDPGAIRPATTLEIKLAQENEEMLLFDFLNELIFYKDAKRLLLLPSEISIERDDNQCSLTAKVQGEEVDALRHRADTDVKAVTMLRFSVQQVEGGWRATVVLDV